MGTFIFRTHSRNGRECPFTSPVTCGRTEIRVRLEPEATGMGDSTERHMPG